MTTPTQRLLQELIAIPSIAPDTTHCQDIIQQRLKALGFSNKTHNTAEGVRHFWSLKEGCAPKAQPSKTFAFLAHSDVVPAGPRDLWNFDPFTLTSKGEDLLGRGVCDMKGGLAAMVVACERFFKTHACSTHNFLFLVSGNEELVGVDHGAKILIDDLRHLNTRLAGCVVGEPSSHQRTGDCLRIGRRGVLHGRLALKGVSGHVAYPLKIHNPLHALAHIVCAANTRSWDANAIQANAMTSKNHKLFPPTSLQFVKLSQEGGAVNTTPASATAEFDFRFNPCVFSPDTLRERFETLAHETLVKIAGDTTISPYHLSIAWEEGSLGYITPEDSPFLVEARAIIEKATGKEPLLDTGGGTSDGRFIATWEHTPVFELGLPNETIHKPNECIKRQDLETLTKLYEQLLKAWLL